MSSAIVAGTPNQREVRKEATRRKVYESAMAVFRRDGIAAARVEDIVRLAGVSRGTFYFHFATKEHVILELFAEQEAGILAALAALPEDAPLREVLERLSLCFEENWGSEAVLMFEAGPIALRSAGRNAPAAPGTYPVLDQLIVRMQRLGCPEAASGVSPQLAATLFLFDLLVGTIGWSRYRHVPLGSVLQSIVELFIRGLRTSYAH